MVMLAWFTGLAPHWQFVVGAAGVIAFGLVAVAIHDLITAPTRDDW